MLKNFNCCPPTKLWEGNVFICVCPSVSQSVNGGPHVTITYDALDITVQCPAPSPGRFGHQTWDPPAPVPLLVTSVDHHWRPVLTCSFEDPHEQRLVVTTEAHAVSTGRQNASYWNAFFFKLEIYKWSTFMTCFSLFITRYDTFKT